MSSERSGGSRTVLVVVGVALIVFGAYALAERSGLVSAWIPSWLSLNWSELRTGMSLILIGVFVIWLARGGFKTPVAGTRLYRTTDDKWVAGVLGGLARYFGIDATLLRLLFIAVAVIGEGWIIFPYFLMAILVPKEPAGATAGAAVPVAAPAPPSAPVPPAPPAPAVAPGPAATPAPETPPAPTEEPAETQPPAEKV